MLKIILPWPASGLFQNETHRAVRQATASLTKEARTDAMYSTMGQHPGVQLTRKIGDYALGLLFCPPPGKRPDLLNCVGALKAALDGVADALGVDDRQFVPVIADWGGADASANAQYGTVTVIIGLSLSEVLAEWPLVVESARIYRDLESEPLAVTGVSQE